MSESNELSVSLPQNEGKKVKNGKSKKPILILVCAVLFLIAAGLVYLMVITTPETSGRIRDIFIVIYALETIVIAAALVVLICQIAQLINMTKNQVNPILKTTQETVNHVKGTVTFLGNNMVEPAIKANSTVAGISKVISVAGSIFTKKK